MEVGGWNNIGDHHHTFSLSFLPLGLFLCHILLTGHLGRVADGGAPASDNQWGWGLGLGCEHPDRAAGWGSREPRAFLPKEVGR